MADAVLSRILDPIREDLALVERELDRQAESIAARCADPGDGLVGRAVRHVLGPPGKRLRPALVLLSARSAGPVTQRQALIGVATVAELVHTASLVHDDIIDAASKRRGQPTVNAVWGNRTAVLVGDLFYAQFFAVLNGLRGLGPQRQLALLDLFCGVTQRMCAAEILEDQIARGREPATLQRYLDIIRGKTASLMAASCESAAILAEAPPGVTRALTGIGEALGMAYQLIDDMADGDASFVDRAVTTAQAREHAETASRLAGSLPPADASRGLRAMSGYVLARLGELEGGLSDPEGAASAGRESGRSRGRS